MGYIYNRTVLTDIFRHINVFFAFLLLLSTYSNNATIPPDYPTTTHLILRSMVPHLTTSRLFLQIVLVSVATPSMGRSPGGTITTHTILNTQLLITNIITRYTLQH